MTTQKPRDRPADLNILTTTEWQVVDAVRHGLTNRQIAERRGISLDAVKYHVSNTLTKSWAVGGGTASYRRMRQDETKTGSADAGAPRSSLNDDRISCT